MRPFDPARHCGAATNDEFLGGRPCQQPKGFRTDHPRTGECFLHGGRSPNGRKSAAKEAAEQAVAKLGIPRGTGDPIALLAEAVRHAQGYLEATASVVAAFGEAQPSASATGRVKLELDAAIAAYEVAMRQAGVIGSATVGAKVAQQLAAVEQRKIELLQLALQRALDRMAPEPEWRDRFLVAIGEELLAIAAPPPAAVAALN